jgi:3-oxoacyl-[acyl-carrier-protein] synthase II
VGKDLKRVVITGLGPVTPVGIGKEEFWRSLVEGRTSFKRITFPERDMAQYRCQVAAPIEGFDLYQFVERTKHSKYLGRTSQFAIAGAWFALKDAGIEIEKNEGAKAGSSEGAGQYRMRGMDSFRAGAILGYGVEAMDLMALYHERFMARGVRGISPFGLPNSYLSAITSHVAQAFSLRGTTYTVSTACASSTHAMINSFLQIQGGRETLMVTGGADACITPLVFGGFDVLRAMSVRNDEPQKACRPFDRDRDGFVMAEGAGVLIFEEMNHALERGAHIHGEVVGFGMTADAHHLTDPDPEGVALAKAIRDALQMGEVTPEEIDYINPHGTATILNDRVETKVIKEVFGGRAYRIPVSSTKSITGHMLGGAGGVEAMAVLLAIEEGKVHPTLNYEFPDPECDLDYVPEGTREKEVRLGLSVSAGFGGVNAAILLRRFEEKPSS